MDFRQGVNLGMRMYEWKCCNPTGTATLVAAMIASSLLFILTYSIANITISKHAIGNDLEYILSL